MFKFPRNAFKYFILGILCSSLFWLTMMSYFMRDSSLHTVKKADSVENGSNEGEDDIRPRGFEEQIGLIKSKDDIEKRDEGYAKFSFNLLVSDRIGYHRKIPDSRHQL